MSSTASLSQLELSVIRAVVFWKNNLTISYTQMKIHQENQTKIIERVMDIKICNSEWCDQAVMSLLIRYTHIPFYFCFSFTFSTLSIHHYAPLLWHDHMTITLTSLDRSRLFDGHMTYNSHVFTSILSISNVPPPAVWPILSSCTTRSGTFYNFTLCSLSCFPFVFNLPVFTFRSEHYQRRATQLPIPVSPRIEI